MTKKNIPADGEIPNVISCNELTSVMSEICGEVRDGVAGAFVSGCKILLRAATQPGVCSALKDKIVAHMADLSDAKGLGHRMMEVDDLGDQILAHTGRSHRSAQDAFPCIAG